MGAPYNAPHLPPMSLLVITLLPGAPGAYPYVTSIDGQTPERHGASPANLLPPAGRGVETVAVVPAARLSWQRVALPKGVGAGSPRLRAVLAGLLEDRLLDEPEQLHFALAPGAAGGAEAWVAVCERDWLRAHLQALDGAGRPAQRIVPELAPDAGPLRLHVVGAAERPTLLLAGAGVAGGVQALPFDAAALSLLPTAPDAAEPQDAIELLAEPAVAELAERWLQRQPTIRGAAQRALLASRSPWDLAQGELARSSRARAQRRLGTLWRDLLHARTWRPVRWGLALLLLANVVGLNAAAWRERDQLAQRQALIREALTQTFPQVKVVVDAPVQMAREVAQLRQATGAPSPRDLEPMLAALGAVSEPGAVAEALDYAAGSLRLRGLRWDAGQPAAANERLGVLGYQARSEGAELILSAREAQP